eukprot:TRINITY_DN846_c0_g1_i6.p1 TRINITY_DN846_c0_g1~~TRINITY_DN846_c0_g1_i6.p1  ORF type:complete len:320 (-),score=132.53 TRINITY_DN846_c0_g1_i6:107-1066(-)
MAKFGEGDPRWVVSDRSDGTNVNNWHWKEIDCSGWSKDCLNRLFANQIIFQQQDISVQTKDLEIVSIEVTLNNRKGKQIWLYEVELKLPWTVNFNGSNIDGKFHLPYIADENGDTSHEVKVNTDIDSKEAQILKEIIRVQCISIIQQKIALWLKTLREEYGPKYLLQSQSTNSNSSIRNSTSNSQSNNNNNSINSGSSNSQQSNTSSNNNNSGSSTPVKTLKMDVKFLAPLNELFHTLLDAQRISAFTQSQSIIKPEKNFEYSLLSGAITGRILDIEPNSKIIKTWRFSSWPTGIFTFIFYSYFLNNNNNKKRITNISN